MFNVRQQLIRPNILLKKVMTRDKKKERKHPSDCNKLKHTRKKLITNGKHLQDAFLIQYVITDLLY